MRVPPFNLISRSFQSKNVFFLSSFIQYLFRTYCGLESGYRLGKLKHFNSDVVPSPVGEAFALTELTIAFWLCKTYLEEKILSLIYLRFPIKGKLKN